MLNFVIYFLIIVNSYSVGIVGFLIVLFFIVYIIAEVFDEKDNKTKIYWNDPNYDTVQQFTIKFFKADIKEKITFFGLFIYLIKVNI